MSQVEKLQEEVNKLTVKLARKPITADFGEQEVKIITNKYKPLLTDYWSPEARKARQIISNFHNECLVYRGIML